MTARVISKPSGVMGEKSMQDMKLQFSDTRCSF